MATKQFTRTVEAINTLLDKLALMPDSPANYKGILTNPSYLPEEPTAGDMYLVQYSDTANEHLANYLYYRKATAWDIIATKGYTPYEIDTMLSSIAAADIAMTGYEKSSSSDPLPIATTDTASEAIGKLEQQAGLNKNNILWNTQNGVKNLLNVNLSDLKSFNSSNVTWRDNVATSTDGHIIITFNADNTLTVYSDGSNAQLEFKLATQANSPLPNGALVLSGCPDTGSASTYDLRAVIASSPIAYINNYSGGTEFEYTGNTYTASIVIRANQTINKAFRPMICLKSLYDLSLTYQPYAMSNSELTAAIQAIQAQLNQ